MIPGAYLYVFPKICYTWSIYLGWGKHMLIYLQIMETAADQTKFERLHTHYQGLMYHIAYDILHNREDAEEAVNDALWKIAKNIEKITEAVCPKTRAYVVLVIESASVDLWRKRRRRIGTVPLEEEPKIQVAYEGANRMANLILQLPPHDREILLLRFYQGYSLKEAAKLLDLTYAAARKREQRAKERLEKLCREEGLL